jgi:hypothetical protein
MNRLLSTGVVPEVGGPRTRCLGNERCDCRFVLPEDRTVPHTDMSFREAAEECRRLAAKATDPVEKQALHQIADQWLRLAQVAGAAPNKSPAGLEGA